MKTPNYVPGEGDGDLRPSSDQQGSWRKNAFLNVVYLIILRD